VSPHFSFDVSLALTLLVLPEIMALIMLRSCSDWTGS